MSYRHPKDPKDPKDVNMERSYSMFKVRRGSHEEIPLVQGKEQWLFALLEQP